MSNLENKTNDAIMSESDKDREKFKIIAFAFLKTCSAAITAIDIAFVGLNDLEPLMMDCSNSEDAVPFYGPTCTKTVAESMDSNCKDECIYYDCESEHMTGNLSAYYFFTVLFLIVANVSFLCARLEARGSSESTLFFFNPFALTMFCLTKNVSGLHELSEGCSKGSGSFSFVTTPLKALAAISTGLCICIMKHREESREGLTDEDVAGVVVVGSITFYLSALITSLVVYLRSFNFLNLIDIFSDFKGFSELNWTPWTAIANIAGYGHPVNVILQDVIPALTRICLSLWNKRVSNSKDSDSSRTATGFFGLL